MTEAVSLRSIFEGPTIYEAPIFQRRYTWATSGKRPEISRFWDDVANIEQESAETLFLGATITKPIAHSSTTRAERFLIVDGQQRLTTLALTIAAIAFEAHDSHLPDLVDTIVRDYLTVSSRRDDRGAPKILVTTPDLAEYEDILRGLMHAGIKVGHPGKFRKGRLSAAFDRARTEVHARVSENSDPEQLLTSFLDLLLDKVELVEIQLSERHDANEVFDRLNRQGAPLTVGDLVRNHVFGIVGGDRELAKRLNEEQWAPFEESLNTPDALDSYYFPFALVRDRQTTKSRAMDSLDKRWRELNKSETEPSKMVRRIVQDLAEFVPAFMLLFTGSEFPSLPNSVSEQAKRLWRMRPPSVIYPFPMQVLQAAAQQQLPPDQARQSLEIVESFLVRRAFQGLEPTGLHAVFKNLWSATEGEPLKVRKSIESTTIRFPNDDEFVKQIAEGNLYGRRLSHYVLEEYERSIRQGGDPLAEEQLREFQIDHVAPQSLRGSWAQVFSSEQDRELIDTWGNLVPLSSRANSTKSTMNWTDARDLLRQDTIFKSTRVIYEEEESWTPSAVRRRNEKLAKWAVERWPAFAGE